MDEVQKLTQELSDSKAETSRLLSEKDAENKRLSEALAKVADEKREKTLAEGVEKLCLSTNKNIAFKGGEKEKVLAFVKTLSDDQAKAYFELHEGIITGVDLGEHGEVGEGDDTTTQANQEAVDTQAQELSAKTGMTLGEAYKEILGKNKKLAEKIL